MALPTTSASGHRSLRFCHRRWPPPSPCLPAAPLLPSAALSAALLSSSHYSGLGFRHFNLVRLRIDLAVVPSTAAMATSRCLIQEDFFTCEYVSKEVLHTSIQTLARSSLKAQATCVRDTYKTRCNSPRCSTECARDTYRLASPDSYSCLHPLRFSSLDRNVGEAAVCSSNARSDV